MTIFSTFALFLAIIASLQQAMEADICTDSVCTFHLYVNLAKTMYYRGDDHILHPVELIDGQPLVTLPSGNLLLLTPNDVIIADGVARDVILFNGTLPGPTLEVMEGARVNVIVHNQLKQKALSVHWHGILQTNTYFMDGTAYVTQCPIPPGQKFKYQFVASPQGTHWYHPQLDSIRLDGAFGILIVHRQPPVNPYFAISVNDWFQTPFETLALTADIRRCENGASGPEYKITGAELYDCSFDGVGLYSNAFRSALFDGLGRLPGSRTPLKQYTVQPNGRYRFRMVHTGYGWPLLISVDGHKLFIVASNGADVQPILVDSFFIEPSESIDFEMDTDQQPIRYWFRADTQCDGKGVKGILVYQGFENDVRDPSSQPRNCTTGSPCIVFNCPFGRYPLTSNKQCIPMVQARSTLSKSEQKVKYGINSSDVVELFLNVAMNVGPSVNGRRFMMPSEPLFQNPYVESDCYGEPCSDGCSCQCTNIMALPYNRTIRLIISNLQPNPNITQDAYHQIHIHGYNFALLAQEFPTYDSFGKTTSPNSDITCGGDVTCAHPRWTDSSYPTLNFNNPVIKDTVALPAQGYIVIQFVANNPGYWMLHCNNDAHMLDGMTVVFRVAPEMFPRLPTGFPTCFEFI